MGGRGSSGSGKGRGRSSRSAPLKWKASTAKGHFNRTGHYVSSDGDNTYNIDNTGSGWTVSVNGSNVGTADTFAEAKKLANNS